MYHDPSASDRFSENKGEKSNEEVTHLRERLETRKERINKLDQQLARRSNIEEKVDEVALKVREDREERNALFFVRWYC